MSLRILEDPQAAGELCRSRRSAGHTVGFVPTMGALHPGHVSLVERSVAENDFTCVSVFVNPLQFDDPKDLERYPRDLAGDGALLEAAGCDLLFTGTPPGVGAARNPKVFLQPGDVAEVEIEGLGVLKNPVIAGT